MKIGDRIKSEVMRQGLSGYGLAKLSGVSSSSINRFLSGERDLSLDSASTIAETLRLVLVPDNRVLNDEALQISRLRMTAKAIIADLELQLGELDRDSTLAKHLRSFVQSQREAVSHFDDMLNEAVSRKA